MLYEFLQDAEEDSLCIEGTALHSQAAHYLVLHHIEEEVEVVSFSEELKGNDDHLQVIFLSQQILQYFGHLSDLPQFLVYVLDCQHLAVL